MRRAAMIVFLASPKQSPTHLQGRRHATMLAFHLQTASSSHARTSGTASATSVTAAARAKPEAGNFDRAALEEGLKDLTATAKYLSILSWASQLLTTTTQGSTTGLSGERTWPLGVQFFKDLEGTLPQRLTGRLAQLGLCALCFHLILQMQPRTRPTKHPLGPSRLRRSTKQISRRETCCLHLLSSSSSKTATTTSIPGNIQAPARTGQADCFKTSAKMTTGKFIYSPSRWKAIWCLRRKWLIHDDKPNCMSLSGWFSPFTCTLRNSEITNHVILEYLLESTFDFH